MSFNQILFGGIMYATKQDPFQVVLYINDLSNCLSLTLPFIYADDTKCIRAISTIDDSRLMQSDLDSISSDTELFFNESKFAHICF